MTEKELRIAKDMHAELGKMLELGATSKDFYNLLEQTMPLLAGRNESKMVSMGAGIDCTAMDALVRRVLDCRKTTEVTYVK